MSGLLRYDAICQYDDEGDPVATMIDLPRGAFVLYSDHVAAMQSRTPAPAVEAVIEPIERDIAAGREYIPLPDGWEIHTKGSGSSFRIVNTHTEDRLAVPDSPYLHDTLTNKMVATDTLADRLDRMAEDAAACGEPLYITPGVLDEIRAELRARGGGDKVAADNAKLRAFACEIMDEFHLGDLDGGSRQDIAVKHGVLIPVEVTYPCGDNCECAGYGDFPQTCYRLAPLVTGAVLRWGSQSWEFPAPAAAPGDGWVDGEAIEVGDDEDGQPRILIHTTREAIKAGPAMAFRRVRVSIAPPAAPEAATLQPAT